HPGVLIEGLAGSATGHANYFLVVSVEVGRATRRSAICVEFKNPYGQNKVPPLRSLAADALSEESAFDRQMRMAGLPTVNYGRWALGEQLRTYVRTIIIYRLQK
ncbi:hypothetical protein H4S00_003789, partial [Coemansia sp. D1744]